MDVIVEITLSARQRLLALLERTAAAPIDALLMAATYCDEVERLLTARRAPPPGARLRVGRDGASWWLFADGLWFGFTRRDETVGHWPFRRIERTFTVFSTSTRPPAGGTPPPPG